MPWDISEDDDSRAPLGSDKITTIRPSIEAPNNPIITQDIEDILDLVDTHELPDFDGGTTPEFLNRRIHNGEPLDSWDEINQVPDTPGESSHIGHSLKVTGTDDQDYAWRENIEDNEVTEAKLDSGVRGKLNARSGMATDMSNLDNDLTDNEKSTIRGKLGVTGSGPAGTSDYNALSNRPVLSNINDASAATVGKLVLNDDDAELTRETVHHQQTPATATWADYANASYLGAFNTQPVATGRRSGTWYFDIPHKRARLVNTAGPIASWTDARISAVISRGVYIGEFNDDNAATLHATATNNVYWNNTTESLRISTAFTAASGTTTRDYDFIRVATGEDVERLQNAIDAAGGAFDAADARAALNLVFAEIQVEPAGVPGLVLPDYMALRLDGKLIDKTIERIVVNLGGAIVGGVTRNANPTPPAVDGALPFNQTIYETSGGIINLAWTNASSKRTVENTIQQTRQGRTTTLQSLRGSITYTFTDGTTHEDIWHFGVANNAFDNTYTPPSDATPQALGTASAGTSHEVARADHVHPEPAPAGKTLIGSANVNAVGSRWVDTGIRIPVDLGSNESLKIDLGDGGSRGTGYMPMIEILGSTWKALGFSTATNASSNSDSAIGVRATFAHGTLGAGNAIVWFGRSANDNLMFAGSVDADPMPLRVYRSP